MNQPALKTSVNTKKVNFDTLVKDVVGFEKLSVYLKKIAGISLSTNEKSRSLMASRLMRVISDLDLSNYDEYISYLKNSGANATQQFVSALTTNTTQFFRESLHFDVLKNHLDELFNIVTSRHNKELRVWCAAASRGQEPYSILMSILSKKAVTPQSVRLLASDIDIEVLSDAARGVYSKVELENVSNETRLRFFKQLANRQNFQVKHELRDRISFSVFNLVYGQYSFSQKFDVIFCRNVLIYFEKQVAEKVIEKLVQQLRIGGLLFVGHCETGFVQAKNLKVIAHAVYEKVE